MGYCSQKMRRLHEGRIFRRSSDVSERARAYFLSCDMAFVTCSVITIIMSVLTCPTTVRTVARIDLFAYAMVKGHAAILLPATGVVGMVVLTIALLLNIIFF
jgi:hypothetical protein